MDETYPFEETPTVRPTFTEGTGNTAQYNPTRQFVGEGFGTNPQYVPNTTVPLGNLDPAGWPASATPGLDYPVEASNHRCSRDRHFFECRHETKCECGYTQRTIDAAVPWGL